jgi:CshA-type fibril repeat protein
VTIPGEGVYTADADGVVRFTAAAGFEQGQKSSVAYTVKDARGVSVRSRAEIELTAASLPVPPALVRPASPGAPATFDPAAGTISPDAGVAVDATSVQLIDPASDTPSPSGVVTIAGEGTYTLDPATGQVAFVPEAGFVGDSSIAYTIADSRGLRGQGTLTANVSGTPSTTPVDETVVPGQLVPIDLTGDFVRSGGVGPDWTTLRLIDAQGLLVTELVTPAGTYTLDPARRGTVMFRSAAGFPGFDETSSNATGTTQTTRSIILDPAGSVVARDGGTVDRRSVKLVGAGGALVDTLAVPGKGTFAVDPATGLVTFTAVDGFIGTVEAPFSIADDRGLRTRGTLTVDVTPATATTPAARAAEVLARTGSRGAAALVGGAALLLTGAGALVLSRRRTA